MGKNEAVVNVATGSHYQIGQKRLGGLLDKYSPECAHHFWDRMPPGSPDHWDKPFAFKACALMQSSFEAELLLWCDASIKPVRNMHNLWRRIEKEGYWLAASGENNYEWTADSAYPELFPERPIEEAREVNREIRHVIGTAFGVNTRHPLGSALLTEFYKLSCGDCFRGPWTNFNSTRLPGHKTEPCGPPDVKGHRHDQTSLSVLAWRLGLKLDTEVLEYSPTRLSNVLMIDGDYEWKSPYVCPSCGNNKATVEVDDGAACNRCGIHFHGRDTRVLGQAALRSPAST